MVSIYQNHQLITIRVTNLPLLESIENGAFSNCERLSSVDLSARSASMPFLAAFPLKSVTLKNFPLLESIGEWAFPQTMRRVDLLGVAISPPDPRKH